MARYKYEGRDRNGKRNGILNAATKRDALIKLKEEGIRIIEIMEVPETFLTKDISIGNPVKLQHFVVFLRQFATLIRAGITVVDAMKILADQTESKHLRKALFNIEQDLREGNPISLAVGKYPKIFSSMFVNMVRAGEASGSMDETLERLATHYEKQHFTRQKIISALTYPIVVGMIAIIVVTILLVFVVPTFVSMFADLGGKLPTITRFVLNASAFMQSFWWLLALVAVLIAFLIVFLRKNKQTKYYLDIFLLRMPIFGKMLQKAAIARMTRTLSSLFSSSVPILQAMSIVEKIVENEVMAKVMRQSRESLEKGRSMTEPMKGHWAFPPLVTQMIVIGEQTGALDAMLSKIADFYEKEVEIGTDKLKSLIEPIMIVLLATIVGTIVLSIMLPMFDMFNQFNKKY